MVQRIKEPPGSQNNKKPEESKKLNMWAMILKKIPHIELHEFHHWAKKQLNNKLKFLKNPK